MILSFGDADEQHEVSIEPAGVTRRRRWRGEDYVDQDTLERAFLGGFWRFSAPPAEAFAGHRRLAELLDPSTLSAPRDRDRVRFVRRYDPTRLVAEDLSWSRDEGDGKPDSLLDLALTPEGLRGATPRSRDERRKLHMPDEAYFLGPVEHGMPLGLRDLLLITLRSSLAPGAAFESGDGFPRLDHARIGRRDWEWNHQSNGCEGATVEGSWCMVGYQFAQDGGYGYWSVERAVTDAQGVLLTAPAEIRAEIAAHILGAQVG